MQIKLDVSLSKVGKTVLGSLLLVPLVFFAYYLTRPTTFPISHVKVYASFHQIMPSRVHTLTESYVDTGFFAFKAKSLEQALLGLPWVDHVSIKKQFPGTIVITLQEKQPVARWGLHALFTADGQLFYPDTPYHEKKLVQLVGPSGYSSKVFDTYEKMNKVLNGPGLSISRCELTERMAWEIQLNDGMEVLLGRSQPFERLDRFVRIYDRVFAKSRSASKVDLRYASGMAVTWRNEQASEL